jgi:hypothetical protein
MSQYQMRSMPTRDERPPSVFAEGFRALKDQPLRRAVVVYLMLLIALLPLPFGGWRDWGIDSLAIMTAAMLLAVAWGGVTGRAELSRLSIAVVPAALYALALIWAALQASHLPFLRPLWNPLWGEAATALGRPLTASISVDRYKSLSGLVSLGSYGGIFLLALYAVNELRVARMLVRLFIYAATLYAFYGLVVYFTGANVVLWFEKERTHANVVTATFDNRNNFATYCGLALISAIGLFLNEVSRRRQSATKQAAIVLIDRVWRMTWPIVISAGILGTALMLTASRAGATTTLIGVAVLCAVIYLTLRLRPFRPRGLLIAGLIAVALLVALSGDKTTQRLITGLDVEDQRFTVYADTLRGLRDFAMTGTGLGSFEDVFRIYRVDTLYTSFNFAHNDPLEAALELGIPAASAMLLAVGLLVLQCWHELRVRRRGAIFPCIAVAVSVQVALHSLLDFSMQVPAVVIAYLVLLACGLTRADRDAGAAPPAA